jgi:ATP-binding protein involved in chromosome partitioning
VRESSDAGKPVVATDPSSPPAEAYRAIAAAAWAELERHQSADRPAPKIVMEN